MSVRTGFTKADGTPGVLPPGVYDMASLGENIQLTPEQEAKVKETMERELPEDPNASRARYKLEIYLSPGRRHNDLVRGSIQCWENGGYLHGSGDMSLYLCPLAPYGRGAATCLHPVDVSHPAGGKVYCPACGGTPRLKDLVNILTAELSMQNWARLLTRFFFLLGCSADLVHYIPKHSLIKATEAETDPLKKGGRGGELYARRHAKLEEVVYPLVSIIRDTATGATLDARIKAFLEA